MPLVIISFNVKRIKVKCTLKKKGCSILTSKDGFTTLNNIFVGAPFEIFKLQIPCEWTKFLMGLFLGIHGYLYELLR
jgi:hypothetical protein